MHKSLVVLVLFVMSCVAVRQQNPVPAKSPQKRFKNLKVLPPDISHDDLVVTMRAWTASLGVSSCDHCHLRIAASPRPGVDGKIDFVSDAKREKAVARLMFKMTRLANADYISRVAQPSASITCYTCHQGRIEPMSTLPPAPQK